MHAAQHPVVDALFIVLWGKRRFCAVRITVLFAMLEYVVELLKDLPAFGVLVFVFCITFVENVFPPSPSDMLLVFCGTLVGLATVGFVPMLLAATAGSIAGFAVMYWVGWKFGHSLVESRKIKFLPYDAVEKAERWFQRYGMWLIVVNRFLSGTRAIIAFFAGMSSVTLPQTLVLSAISAGAWNTILIFAGAALGKNWMQIHEHLTLYGQVVMGIVVAIVVVMLLRAFVRSRSASALK